METETLHAILRLQNATNIGPILAKKLIVATGDVSQIFKEKAQVLEKIHGIGSTAIRHLFASKNEKNADKELRYIQETNCKYTYFLDPSFPANLAHCVDGPLLLFSKGVINFSNPRILSIVGTRNMTPYGNHFCNQFIEALAPYNPIIISGFAYGIDITAHKAAMKHGLQTVAVLAHGLETMYPKAHQKYSNQLQENGGFLTEFWHDETPFRTNFLQRNRIVAGISKATVVIESAVKGGSLVTADIANSYNRDVFALPGKSTDRFSKGCNRLIQTNQAHLLDSASDIVKMLNWDLTETPKKPIQQQLFVSFTPEEQDVYNTLLAQGTLSLDALSKTCEMPTYKMAPLLLQLELKGVLQLLPGKQFKPL